VENIDNKVDELSENIVKARVTERLVWVIIVAVVSAAFTYIGK